MTTCTGNRNRRGLGVAAALAVSLSLVASPGSVDAHEGHAALPSTGATIDGDKVLISEGARKGLGLKTATVTLADLRIDLRARTRVELPWEGQAMVTTLIPGRVTEILVKTGEQVAAEQQLARIESVELEKLQLTMLQAVAAVDAAQQLVAQRRPLVENGSIRGRLLAEAETELRQRRVELKIAERKLRALGLTDELLSEVRESGRPISSIPVLSPLGGVVTHTDIRVGQYVDTEHHLFNIVDRSRVLLVADVLESDAWQIEPRQSVTATFPALADAEYKGEVDRLRLQMDTRQHTLPVVVPIENADGRLRPGMFGRMTITVAQAEQAIVCPVEALLNTPGRTFVLVRQGEGKFQRREIKIGLRTPELVEIEKGLFPGDKVVVTGTRLLGSMFHTELKTTSKKSSSGHLPAAGGRSNQSIPAAQGVVGLPASRKAFAGPVIEGRIVNIRVQPGEFVEKGELLAELDSQELRNLQLDLLATNEKLRMLHATIEKVEPLVKSGGFPKTQLWELQLQDKTQSHKLRNLKRQLSMVGLPADAIERLLQTDLSTANMELEFATVPVRAPIAGRLAEFEVVLGEVVHASDSLFEIQDLSTVLIEGYVFERHAPRIEVGQSAEIRFPGYPDLKLEGQIVRTSPTLLSASRVLPVWIEVQNPDRTLREGLQAQIHVRAGSTAAPIASRAEVRE